MAQLLLWSVLAVFSQLALIRLVVTTAGGTGYYANLLLLFAAFSLAAGFLARRWAPLGAAIPALLFCFFSLLQWLGTMDLVETMPSEFLWSSVADLHPKAAEFDLQLATYLIIAAVAPVMALTGSQQGRAFLGAGDPSRAYLVMAGGGLLGGAVFTLQNQLLSDPLSLLGIWCGLLVAGLWPSLGGLISRVAVLAPVAALLLVALPMSRADHYSPYQRVSLIEQSQGWDVMSNGFFLSFCAGVPLDELNPSHRLWSNLAFRHVGDGERVLVVGSGTGTVDVREAVAMGAGSVDAVEIDPVFLDLGRQLDPMGTYDRPDVHARAGDGRAFLSDTEETWDVIYYPFVDSQSLASNHARFRLDSFLYTVEGLRLAWSRVADGGVLFINFFTGTSWIRDRMYDLLVAATGERVRVVLNAEHHGGALYVVSKGRPIGIPTRGAFSDATAEFEAGGPNELLPTDDWPFFYSEHASVPWEYMRLLVGLLFAMGTVLLLADRFSGDDPVEAGEQGEGSARWDLLVYATFSGAAFFFLELRTIAAVAPVLGSTYLAQASTVMAVIGVSLLGALVGVALPNLRRSGVWALLFGALGLAFGATAWFHPLTGAVPSRPLFLLLLLLPVTFAGLLYFQYVREQGSAMVLSMQKANIAGGALGGMAEAVVVMTGFQASLWLGVALYALALAGVLYPSVGRSIQRWGMPASSKTSP